MFIGHGINAEEEADLINELENLTLEKVNQELGLDKETEESRDSRRMKEKHAEENRQFLLDMQA